MSVSKCLAAWMMRVKWATSSLLASLPFTPLLKFNLFTPGIWRFKPPISSYCPHVNLSTAGRCPVLAFVITSSWHALTAVWRLRLNKHNIKSKYFHQHSRHKRGNVPIGGVRLENPLFLSMGLHLIGPKVSIVILLLLPLKSFFSSPHTVHVQSKSAPALGNPPIWSALGSSLTESVVKTMLAKPWVLTHSSRSSERYNGRERERLHY